MVEDLTEKPRYKQNIQNLSSLKSLTVTDEIFQFILDKWFSSERQQIVQWLSSINDFKYKFGTKEWADDNFNTHYACKHACWYCYAWSEAYQRKRSYCKDWGKKMERRDYWDKGWKTRKNGYTIMYPTTHDILPDIMDDCFHAIKNMLKANINVLLVSKPHFEVIKKLVNLFKNYRSGQPKITLRFTIGTNNSRLLSFWEPNAPSFEERFKSLQYAYKEGFYTSVSMEPFFPPLKDPEESNIKTFIPLVEQLLPFVRGTLWLGKMNHIPVNVQRGKPLTTYQKEKITSLKIFYRWGNIYSLLQHFHLNNKVMWKESIKKSFIEKIVA